MNRFDQVHPWKRHDRCRVSHEGVDELATHAVTDSRGKSLTYCESGDAIVIVQTDEDGTRHVLACSIDKEFKIPADDCEDT
jgi:hypothetical protein